MDRFLRVPRGYGITQPLTYPGPGSHSQQQNWPQNMGAPVFLARPRVPANVSQPFLFLEPKYGYFHCKDCKTRWESAYVWCITGTNKVYFKQLCSKCQKSFNPYRVEAIQCQTCLSSCCSCSQKKRHINLRRPHRQELCGHCKDKKFPCSVFYSFK
eukprot:XP_008767267.1 PREDICTED: ZAR1-like protein isoform X1 [Rattus norvegicus]